MKRNRGHTYREQLGPQARGRGLLAYLAERYRHSSVEEWRARIEAGRVRLDGRTGGVDQELRPGQWLEWDRPAWVEPAAPLDFAVLYRDPDVVAIAKPSGLPTLPGGGFLDHTLLHQLRRYDADLRPLHRLGRHTSGIVLCSRSPTAHRRLDHAWRDGAVRKVYRALASGDPKTDRFEISSPIGPLPYAPLGTVHAASSEGKPARSTVRVLERRDDGFLCDVEIATGRPHQIRIHLAAAGHPLVGDPLYVRGGTPDPFGTAVPGDGGYALHAMTLAFPMCERTTVAEVRCAAPRRLRTIEECR